jgi:hypothetical protein
LGLVDDDGEENNGGGEILEKTGTHVAAAASPACTNLPNHGELYVKALNSELSEMTMTPDSQSSEITTLLTGSTLVGYVGHVVLAKSLENADTRHVCNMSATCRADMSATWWLSLPFLARHRRHHVGMPTTCPRHAYNTLKESTKISNIDGPDVQQCVDK